MATSLHALDSKLNLVAQRIKIIENNEQVIGRTLVAHNKKLKELSDFMEKTKESSGAGETTSQTTSVDTAKLKSEILAEVNKKISELPATTEKSVKTTVGDKETTRHLLRLSDEVNKLTKQVDDMRQQVKEVNYVLETINPMSYVTYEQVREIAEDVYEGKREKKTPKTDSQKTSK